MAVFERANKMYANRIGANPTRESILRLPQETQNKMVWQYILAGANFLIENQWNDRSLKNYGRAIMQGQEQQLVRVVGPVANMSAALAVRGAPMEVTESGLSDIQFLFLPRTIPSGQPEGKLEIYVTPEFLIQTQTDPTEALASIVQMGVYSEEFLHLIEAYRRGEKPGLMLNSVSDRALAEQQRFRGLSTN